MTTEIDKLAPGLPSNHGAEAARPEGATYDRGGRPNMVENRFWLTIADQAALCRMARHRKLTFSGLLRQLAREAIADEHDRKE
jgi:hypothetical protein